MRTATETITIQLRDRIRNGEWAAGQQIPVLDDLVAEYEVSGVTIRRAQDALKREGLLRSEHGRGVFVEDELPPELGEGATSIEPTLNNIALLVEWMIEENVDASEGRRAIEKFHLYQDWAYAALNDLDYDEMDSLHEQVADLDGNLPTGWTLTVRLVDYWVECPHHVRIHDSESARIRGKNGQRCPEGCNLADRFD